MSTTLLVLLAGLLAADPATGPVSDPAADAAEAAAEAAALAPLPADDVAAEAEDAEHAADAPPPASGDAGRASDDVAADGEPADIAQMCRDTICQHDVTIRLTRPDGGEPYEHTFDVLPGVVQGTLLMLVPGQTLNIEIDTDADGPTAYRVVDTVTNPAITMTASFEQMDDGGMMLHLQNPFDRTLKFRMGMLPLDGTQMLATSSCPLQPKMGLFEMWPEPILQLVLADGRFVDDGQTLCE